jgi:predicted amidohydrolase
LTRASAQPDELVIGLAQIATCPAQLRHNLERHLEMVERARRQGVQLLVFPELSLSGYLLAHGVLELAMRPDDARLEPLRAASRSLAILVGLPLREATGGISNAAVLLEDGEVRGIHRKLYLPTYGMFDEGRYFIPGPRLAPLETSFGRLGVLICEDAWHMSSAVLLARAGAEALFIVAGGPSELDGGDGPAGARRWHWIVGATAITTVCPVFFANRCGWEEGVLFGGSSWAVDGRGHDLVAPASLADETLVVASFSRSAAARARTLVPIPFGERLDLWRKVLDHEHD